MVCRKKKCENTEIQNFKYCGIHLCNKFKRDGITRCKNVKFDKEFCFLHRYNRNNILGIISLVLAIFILFFGNDVYYFFRGSLTIDYQENRIYPKDGVNYAQIEILNNLGYTLENVSGTLTLNCTSFDFETNSETFKLEGGRNYLSNKEGSTFLVAPDPFFVNLAKTKDFNCSNAFFEINRYIKINNTHSNLTNILSYDFFEESSGNVIILKKEYSLDEEPAHRSCLLCNITITINTDNLPKPIIKKEGAYKFVSGQTKLKIDQVIETPDLGLDIRYIEGHVEMLNPFKFCDYLDIQQCMSKMCRTIKAKYPEFSGNCENLVGVQCSSPAVGFNDSIWD